MKIVDANAIEELIKTSPPGKNTRFLSAAHSLWYRFKNYDKCPPTVYEVEAQICSIIFATHNRDGYANLYEIVTLEGKEGKGYATKCWEEWIHYASVVRGSTRLKLSCTPSSVTWHYRNGLIFWAVDPTGSLRSDQPLFPVKKDQISFRERAITDPSIALPPEKSKSKLITESLESYNWGEKKRQKTEEAIRSVGTAWLRNALLNNNSLESFLS